MNYIKWEERGDIMEVDREVIGIDCCGQEIVPLREELSFHTNCHPNCDGSLWGWIEGCDKNICWANNKSFNMDRALELVSKWNERFKN